MQITYVVDLGLLIRREVGRESYCTISGAA